MRLFGEDRQDAEEPDAYERTLKKNGNIVLTPQPHDDPNDPLNWKQWKRDVMLMVIGFHSLVGGGQTPILAAGFKTISKQFGVPLTKMSYTTGGYMFALGIGSVFAGPAAAIYGKRCVYLGGQIIFCAACVWAALSPTYASLLAARIVEGFGVSPVECLPSSSIAEIYFLHERAFRIGIYSMLLLGGKNIVPLVSAAIIESLGWRWVFGIVALIVGFNFVATYFFVLETAWDRNVQPAPSLRTISQRDSNPVAHGTEGELDQRNARSELVAPRRGLLSEEEDSRPLRHTTSGDTSEAVTDGHLGVTLTDTSESNGEGVPEQKVYDPEPRALHSILQKNADMRSGVEQRPATDRNVHAFSSLTSARRRPVFQVPASDIEGYKDESHPIYVKKTWRQQLAITNGRLTPIPYWKILLRPFVLYAYPAIAYSTVVYSFSVVWLIVMSESLSQIFQAAPYDFNALSIGLLYVAPLIGGILGSSVAGKLSDILTRYMSRRNGGIYEPEFRLVLAIPVALVTSLGLMGFGWSTYVKDPWIAPAVFFGCISFGCSLGSTMSISFVVDSYKQHAGEALVTLNLTKNTIGFIFSLWLNDALTADGSRTLFVILGSSQIVACVAALPLYIYGKRCRSWTYRKGMVDWLYE